MYNQLLEDILVEQEKGECYRNAGMKAIATGGNVVHGEVFAPNLGKFIKHAWVEVGDQIIDPTVDLETTREDYYSKFKAKPSYSVPSNKIFRIARNHTWGPWTEEEINDV